MASRSTDESQSTDSGRKLPELGLGRLRRAHFVDHIKHPKAHSPSGSPISGAEFSFIRSKAARLERRAYSDLNSAEKVISDLVFAKQQLEDAIQSFERSWLSERGPREQKELDLALQTLARIHVGLGNYKVAESIYAITCPMLRRSRRLTSDEPRSHSTAIVLDEHELDMLLDFLHFTSTTHHHLTVADTIGMELLRQPRESWTADQRCILTVCLIRIQNLQGKYDIALEIPKRMNSSPDGLSSVFAMVDFSLANACAAAGLKNMALARGKFLYALVVSAVAVGIWHPTTLEIFHCYGVTLKEGGNHTGARSILGECWLGRRYRLGVSHPKSKLTYTELEQCTRSQDNLNNLHRSTHTTVENLSQPCLAFYHTCVNCIIDVLVAAGETSFEEAEPILRALLNNQGDLYFGALEDRETVVLRIKRALARCIFIQGKEKEAISLIQDLYADRETLEDCLPLILDLALFYSRNDQMKSKASTMSRSILFRVDGVIGRDKAQAFQRKLAELDLTHIPLESIINEPLPIRVVDHVGTGAYAVVESIEISGRSYARKSIALPRYNQNSTRKSIQNEISVLRTLTHPHIVLVFCTYEDRSRFAIILQPLASCDLEAFLEQQSKSVGAAERLQPLIWKWLRCLANTLAFIHSKGIGHKDIKTRNILIKNFEPIFTDFGSSHAFLEGNSITEGPASGHTFMYCAPEVVSWDKRSRPADIFSLGCVFTEMATLLDGCAISDYFEFRVTASETSAGGETHAYHATLDLVEAWFDGSSPEVKSLYAEVIGPMLRKNPDTRPNAFNTSEAIQTCFKKGIGYIFPMCYKCYPDQPQSDPL